MSDEQTYTKTQMEQIIKERIAKVAKRATEAEGQIATLQSQMESQQNSLGTVDMLSQQLTEMQQKLKASERKYSRHTTIAKHGLNSDIVDAVEWTYDKEMSTLKKGDRIPLEDWISIHKENPATAPAILRPHLQALQTQQPTEAAPEMQTSVPSQPQASYPNVNANARPAIPDGPDVVTRAMMDPEFYRANREKVIEAWKGQRKGIREQ